MKLANLSVIGLLAMLSFVTARADGAGQARAKRPQPAAPTKGSASPSPSNEDKTSKLQDGSFYKITNVVDGQELALTFVLPGEQCRKDAQTNCASKARVELQKFKGDPTQLWQPEHIDVNVPNSYKLRPRYSDADSYLTGLLRVLAPDNRFLEDADYMQKHNRVSVGVNTPETIGLWSITAQANGKFRIASLKGVEVKKPNEEPYPETWNEPRSLEAYKTKDGRVEVRHGKNADTPNQMWSFTKVQP